jgi:hypothetical protein
VGAGEPTVLGLAKSGTGLEAAYRRARLALESALIGSSTGLRTTWRRAGSASELEPDGTTDVCISSFGVMLPGHRGSTPGIIYDCKTGAGNKLTDPGAGLVLESLTISNSGCTWERDESRRSKHSDMYLAPAVEWTLEKGKICSSNITSQNMYIRLVEMSKNL